MRSSWVAALATLLAVGISTSTRAIEVEQASLDAQQARIGQLEAELEAIKSRLDGGVAPAAYTEYSSDLASASAGFSSPSGSCSSCGDCGGCCDDCDFGCHPYGFYAGGAAVWMKPHFEDNIAVTLTFSAPAINAANSIAFDYDYEVTPRVWLGYVAPQGLGIRGQWWEFSGSAQEVVAFDPGPEFVNFSFAANLPQTIFTQTGTVLTNEAVVANHALSLEIADLEATKRIYGGLTTLTFAGGARYAKMRQHYSVQNRLVDGQIIGYLDNDLGYDGIGPTMALDLRRPILNGSFSLVGGVRGTILFGTTRQQMNSFDTILGTVIGFHREEEVMGVLETNWGVEWSYYLASNGRLFVSGVVEAQLWQGAGSATLDSGDLGLIGFGFTAGVAR